MDKNQLWQIYAKKNPAFEGEGSVTLSAAGLRKFFNQTYDLAHEKGVANGRALAALDAEKNPSVFERFFGKN